MNTGVKAKKQKRLSKADWIQAATEMLVKSSIDDVRVEKVAKLLGATKGSFYWHFKDRQDLLLHILEEWKRVGTFSVQERLSSAGSSPRETLFRYMELPLHSTRAMEAADVELAIRVWSRNSADTALAVEEIDEDRTTNIASLFEEIGFDPEEASIRSHQAYAFLLYLALRRDLDLKKRMTLLKNVHDSLTELPSD